MRYVKNVLRVPRLYDKYKEVLKSLTDEKQLQAHLTSKLHKEIEGADSELEGKEAISAALRMSFTKEFDMENVMKDIL